MTPIQSSREAILHSAVPIAIGFIAFLIVVGPTALNPYNIAWLAEGDAAAHYVGWTFFRNSEWSFPIGLNATYGLEISNSILYSDSIPIFAFIFKLLTRHLLEPFQYFGLWILTAFVLQAWFSWKLIGLVSGSIAVRALGAALFVFSPPMIWRLQCHLSLVGHFLVVAALYLALAPQLEKRKLSWGAILVLSALVHPYFLAMVALVWVADLFGNIINQKLSIQRAAFELTTLISLVAVTCWQAGYFSVGAGVVSHGYGFYRMNLLSIVDASGWSYLLKDIPEAAGDYEGFNYLGLGFIFLFVVALPAMISGKIDYGKSIRRFRILALFLAGLAVFAISNNLGVGLYDRVYRLPELVLQTANVFRASGRMFWPVFYAITFSAIFLIVRGYEKRTAAWLLGLAFVIQIADTSAAWSDIRKKAMIEPKSTWDTPMVDPFWEEAATRYRKVRWLHPGNVTPKWQLLASYAGAHGMATDAVYLARVDSKALERTQRNASELLLSGKYARDTLYVLDSAAVRQAALTLNADTDLLVQIDGFYVLAPGWNKCADCGKVEGKVNLTDLLPPIQLGQRMLFDETSASRAYLAGGWSAPEDWGTWSGGARATILLPPLAEPASSLLIEANPLLSSSHPKQNVELTINGSPAAKVTLTASSDGKFVVQIPEAIKRTSGAALLTLEFYFPDAARPKDIGINDDDRRLALGLIALTVQ